MKKQDFLNLSVAKQEAWVKQNIPDFAIKAYEDTLFGMFYQGLENEIDEYIQYPEAYETYEIIAGSDPGFDEDRQAEIENGASLTNDEKLVLQNYIVENADEASWIGLHGWDVGFDDGQAFIVFWGRSEGQGGIRLEYALAFESEKQAHDYLETFELYTYL